MIATYTLYTITTIVATLTGIFFYMNHAYKKDIKKIPFKSQDF